MRIIFFGTPAFAVASLDAVVSAGYDVAAVVTAADKPAGRGLQLKESAVKQYAVSHGLKVLQPAKLNDPVFLEQIRELAPDLMIVVAFRMMPETLWKLPPLGTFNLHASLLPQYRGAAPINRAIMNGEKETGVTTFFLKHEIDTGNIIFRETTFIGKDETAGELHDRLMVIGSELVVKTVEAIRSAAVVLKPQETFIVPGTFLHTAPKLFPDDCRIHWDRPIAEVHNKIRGLSPFPGAYTMLSQGDTSIHFKVFRSCITDTSNPVVPGHITTLNDKLFIQCLDGMLEIMELQQQGKKKLSVGDFLRGFRNIELWKAQ